MERNSHFSRTRPPLFQRGNKSKLLSLILKRIFQATIQTSFLTVKNYSEKYKLKLRRLQKISSINSQFCLKIVWERMKSHAKLQKCKDRIVKDLFVLAKSIQKSLMKECFYKLQKNVQKSNSLAFEKLNEVKKKIMIDCLKKLYVNTKKYIFVKLKSNVTRSHQLKRVTIINTIIGGAKKRNLLYALSQLKFKKVSHNKELNSKLQDLNMQLQDMAIQVQNKSSTIIRLQQQLAELKQYSISKIQRQDNNSFIVNNSFGNRTGSLSRSRAKQNNSFDKDSNDGSILKQNGSFGSLLGISMLSYRSRGSNAGGSKLDQCACTSCNFRQRYEKYKTTNQTLKKQLQIIKTELDFTKDMNQHLQNQIRSQMTNQQRQRKIEKLRVQLKQSHKQRQILKQKVLKYEKYVGKLKQQFKTKIQQIYRRVKKST